MAKAPGTHLPGSRGSAAPQGRSRGRGLENGPLRTRRASRRRRGRRAREAPAGWLVSPSTVAARHVSFGPRLLAQFQKATRDIAAPTETGPEPGGRPPARRAARAGAPPRRSGCGAVPPPLPGGGGGGQRRRWRPGHGREEPLRSPGQPAAGLRGVPRRAAPRPARGAEPGECLSARQPRGRRGCGLRMGRSRIRGGKRARRTPAARGLRAPSALGAAALTRRGCAQGAPRAAAGRAERRGGVGLPSGSRGAGGAAPARARPAVQPASQFGG